MQRTPRPPRVGIGTDVHRLVDGGPMSLAGLVWPDEPQGLEGHSDADVAAHAACDALLSAAGLGDLGSNFGTADPAWADETGTTMLAETARRVREAGYEIGNVAIQVIGNRPRLAPRRAEAEAALSRAVGASGVGVGDHDRRTGPHRPRRGCRRHRHRRTRLRRTRALASATLRPAATAADRDARMLAGSRFGR